MMVRMMNAPTPSEAMADARIMRPEGSVNRTLM